METKHSQATTIEISKFILAYSFANRLIINHTKLQKILYYIQAWHMVYFNGMRIFDEAPEAWAQGPTYRSIYEWSKELCIFDEEEIKESACPKPDAEDLKSLSEEQADFLQSIMKQYGTMSTMQLLFRTMTELPWNEAREGLRPFDSPVKPISLKTMRSYYAKLLVKS